MKVNLLKANIALQIEFKISKKTFFMKQFIEETPNPGHPAKSENRESLLKVND
jgi:hypothetical protein